MARVIALAIFAQPREFSRAGALRQVRDPGQRLDIGGALAAFISLAALLLYANRGGDWGWASPVSLSMIAAALAAGGVFLWLERSSPQPMLNLALFRSRLFSFSLLSALLNYMAI